MVVSVTIFLHTLLLHLLQYLKIHIKIGSHAHISKSSVGWGGLELLTTLSSIMIFTTCLFHSIFFTKLFRHLHKLFHKILITQILANDSLQFIIK